VLSRISERTGATPWISIVSMCLCSLLIGGLSAWQPLLALGTCAALLVLLLATTSPLLLICILAALSAAIPKAGIKLGTFPLPALLGGLLLAALLLRAQYAPPSTRVNAARFILLLVYLGYVATRATLILDRGLGAALAFAAWAIIPVLFLALTADVRNVPSRVWKSFGVGYLLSIGYAILQFGVGIEQTAVPGITHAFGDDLSTKNNAFAVTGDTLDASKIPSTYQSGNVYGIVSAVFVVLALQRIFRGRGTRLDSLVAIGGLFAVTVSGSRTAFVAVAVGMLLLFAGRGRLARKVTMIGLGILLISYLLASRAELSSRFSVEAALASGGSGRIDQWRTSVEQFGLRDWAFGTSTGESVAEGWAGLISQFGLIGIVLLVTVVRAYTAGRRAWTVPLVVLGLAACIDSSYQAFPLWFIVPVMLAVDTQAAPTHDSETRSSSPSLNTHRLWPIRVCAPI
jgi:hypothetical protein